MASSCRNCWKQGPSIDNQTRKKIWEENYKMRENLRGVQQSEHFWSFQMTRAGCCSMSTDNMTKRYCSLQSLEKIDCSSHCDMHCKGDKTPLPVCQVHKSAPDTPFRRYRDVATTTSPPYSDKSVGPEYEPRRMQILPGKNESAKACVRYKHPDWSRNEWSNAKQHRQQSLQRLRKNEEALQTSINRSKKGSMNIGSWGTEYTRSFKDGTWVKTLGVAPRFQSRVGTPMARHARTSVATMPSSMFGDSGTPLTLHAQG